MLEALIQHKINRSVLEGRFNPIEDTLTSSVFGTLQYLPDDVFWQIVFGGCGNCVEDLPEDIGMIKSIDLWKRLKPGGTTNKNYVEPDVFIRTNTHCIIIEAKKTDDSYNQDESQWEKEITCVRNSSENRDKKIVFIAIGGNSSCKDCEIRVNKVRYVIHLTSWFNMLNSVLNFRASLDVTGNRHIIKLLDNVIKAFEVHHIIKTIWLDSMCGFSIDSTRCAALYGSFVFRRNESESFRLADIKVNIDSLESVWKMLK